jgi:uncharacterized membrane protein YccC
VPKELRRKPEQTETARWIADPSYLLGTCDAAVRKLLALPARAPSLRLLADQTAEILAGISHALNGLALLVGDPARSDRGFGGVRRLRVPDLLPALVNAGRAFVVIGVMALFWIVTEWPSGALAITFAAIGVTLLAPRADQAYAAAMSFMVGTGLAAALAAIVAFAVLPSLAGFAAFSLALGFVLIPAGAGMAQPWQTVTFTAMAANFLPLLAPANQMSYDTAQFYNNASAIVAGLGAAALSFRLLPPLSPEYRTRRLLALTLRDLRRLVKGAVRGMPGDWEGRTYGRLGVMPEEALPLQRAQLLAALSVGTAILQLRRVAYRMGLGTDLDGALGAFAAGNVGIAVEGLSRLHQTLASRFIGSTAMPGARALILTISEALSQHTLYFEGGAAG